MIDDGRILRSYKEDWTTAFQIHPGPESRMSDSQHLLQRYLLQNANLPSTIPDLEAANGHDQGTDSIEGAAQPLLAEEIHKSR